MGKKNRTPLEVTVSVTDLEQFLTDDLSLDLDELEAFDELGIDLSSLTPEGRVPNRVFWAFAWLQLRRTTHPGITVDEARSTLSITIA